MLMALLSVPLVFVRAQYHEFKSVFQLASVFLLGFAPLIYYYYTAWRLAHPGKPLWRSPGFFLLFLSVSMGLALHNARAVVLGWLGQRTPFVRTPKAGTGGLAKRPRYRTGGVGALVLLEGVLAFYFAFGLAAGLYFNDFGLLPFHTLLTIGFSAICYYSVRDDK